MLADERRTGTTRPDFGWADGGLRWARPMSVTNGQDIAVTGVAILSGRWYTLPAGHTREQHACA
jgi:hypothetical protein